MEETDIDGLSHNASLHCCLSLKERILLENIVLHRLVSEGLFLFFIFFFFQFYWDIISIKHYISLRSMALWLLYIIKWYHKFNEHPSSHRYKIKEIEKNMFFLVVRTLGFYSFCTTFTAILIIFIMLYLTSPVFIYLITGGLYLLTATFQFSSPASGNHKSYLFFNEFTCFVSFWGLIDLQ